MNRAKLLAESVNAGRAALHRADARHAEAIARQMIVIEPDHAPAHDLLGLALLAGGRPIEAAESFDRAMQSTPIPPEYIVHLADAWRSAGRPDKAIPIYQRAITAGAALPEVYHNLGVALAMAHRDADARTAYDASLRLRPGHASTLSNRAAAHSAMGQHENALADAEAALAAKPEFLPAGLAKVSALRGLDRLADAQRHARQLTAAHPDSADAWAALAGVLDPAEAAEAWTRASLLRPDDPSILTNLGVSLRDRGESQAAAARFARVVELSPGMSAGHLNLGLALLDSGAIVDALESLRKACELSPDSVDAWLALARVKLNADDHAGALDAARTAASLAPDFPPARRALAGCLERSGRYDEAIPHRRWLAETEPFARTLLSLASCLEHAGQMDESFATATRAHELDPADDDAALAVGHGLLLRSGGADHLAWELYERRLAVLAARDALPRYRSPAWSGERVGTLLLWCGPALGDSVMFARFIHHAAKLAERVILHAPAQAVNLLSRFPGVTATIPRDHEPPEHDAHASLASLPHLLKLGIADSLVRPSIDTLEVERWRDKRLAGKKNVGLVWSGDPTHPNDAARSIPLPELAGLLATPGVAWIALQPTSPRPANLAADWGPQLATLTDTAAAALALDAIVTVDTAAAHIAGTAGARTLTLLPFNPDWRWGLTGETTPWYPSVKLIRRPLGQRWVDTLRDLPSMLA